MKNKKQMIKEMNDPKHKVCKECQFEAQNGHNHSCSQYQTAADLHRFIDGKYRRPCPICQQQGRFGTLDILTAEETKRLKEREGKDSYPDRIAGCDECKFWCDADEI